jgi:predicted TIM-barrel fold metal-dependent hydrolase
VTCPPVIDTHIHLWDLTRFRYPWLDAEDSAPIRSNYLPDRLIADVAEIDVRAFVHVEAGVEPSFDPVEETAWVESVLQTNADRLPPTACVAYADLRTPDLDDVLCRHADFEIVRGIRQELWFDPDSEQPGMLQSNLLSDPTWRGGLQRLAGHDLTFDLLVAAEQLDQACDVFREVPGLPVIIDHLGVPALVDDAPPRQWHHGLQRFAEQVPHSVLKLSGMSFIRGTWTLDDVRPLVRQAIEIFGPERCMFASNFPVERPHTSYEDLWQAYDDITADLSSTERTALFSGTARRVYRFDSSVMVGSTSTRPR